MIFLSAAGGRTVWLSALLLGLGLSACSSANPTGEFLESSGLAPTVSPRSDFVERSRPKTLDYMTIGTADPGRATAAKTPDEVKAAEAELDSDRARNFALGTEAANLGGTPPPPPVPAPAPSQKPARKKTAPKTP
jgi:hypothetical protein